MFAALPKDIIITDILLRLPVKAIGRFRCVSKQWRSLLSSPKFVKAHVNFHIHDPPEHAIFIDKETGDYIMNLATQTCINTGMSGLCYHHISSCHGLVLLAEKNDNDGDPESCTLVLANPITGEARQIPSFWSGEDIPASFCLGYDNLHDDYKIVSLSRRFVKKHNERIYMMDIYSVRTNTRTRVWDCPPLKHYYSRGVFLNGCIHWLVRTDKDPTTITAFRLDTEEFITPKLALPGSIHQYTYIRNELVALDGCLALVVVHHKEDEAIEVWMMKEYGVQDSWTKFTISYLWSGRFFREGVRNFIYPFGDDEVLGVEDCGHFVAYSLRNQVWRDVELTGIPDGFYSKSIIWSMSAFTESLVSPNYKYIKHEKILGS